MSTEIVERNNNVPTVAADQSPMAMMTMAISQGADLGQLEKMMDLQIRWEANEAKKAYVKSMAAFKANPPKINKDRRVSFGQTNYSHASLGNVTEKINAGLGEHGLSAAWSTDQNGVNIKVTCTITHSMGYSESTSLVATADDSGKKNKIQQIGSTISYLQRYTLLALTGLATQDQDDDGVSSGPAPQLLDPSQVNQVVDMMTKAKVDHADYLKYLCVETPEQIHAENFKVIIAELTRIAEGKK